MKYQIQSLVLPTEEKHSGARKLFYRGDLGIHDKEANTLTLGFAQHCDFVTYLNACSWQKWQKYTNAKSLTLHLEILGEAKVSFLGYHKEALTVTQVQFAQKDYRTQKREVFSFTFPKNDEQMVGFEITALSSELKIFGGYFTVEVDDDKVNPVVLSLATTTCKKEEFIIKNVNLIKNELLSGDDDIAKNLYVHVVDNGRTLKETEIVGDHVYLHPNINAGGSGGFARGMIESLHQDPEVTHVLLMDDDVLVLPESIRRTYNLLRLVRDEYKRDFISGAMLCYEDPKTQHEDIGTVDDNSKFSPLKTPFDHTILDSNLQNEQDYIQHSDSYAAWWYCCIPAEIIKENELPLPFFIRVDDVEYSLRSRPHFITMNGICVWHMGFVTKYNAAMNEYQEIRNKLISRSVSGVLQHSTLTNIVYDAYRMEMLRFNYNAVELVIRALEDYLKGPDFIKRPDGEKILQENSTLNNQFKPLSEVEGGNLYRIGKLLSPDAPLSIENRVFFKVTWNGQQFWPKAWQTDNIVVIPFDWSLRPESIAKHTRLLAVNPFNETGCLYVQDRKRFRELSRRYKKAMKYYKQHHVEIEKAYRDARDELTSEKFWREYLGLETDDTKSN